MRTRRLSGSKRPSSELSTTSVRAAVAAHSKKSAVGNAPANRNGLEESSSKKSVFSTHTKKLDGEELSELRATFNAFDLDKSGTIDAGEISKALTRLGMTVSDAKAQAMLREADADRSGSIDFDEFVKVVERARATGGAGAASAFNAVIQTQRATVLTQKQGHTVHSFATEECDAFCDFINAKLAHDPKLAYLLPIREPQQLFASAADGVLLAHLINVAVPETIDLRVLNLHARYPIHRVENLNLTLNAAKAIGLKVVNIGSSDLMEGRPHLVLGLVWQLVKMSLLANINLKANPNLIRLLQEGEELEDLLRLPPEQLLLRWMNYHLEASGSKKRVKNFGSDLKDCEAYITVLSQLDPGCSKSALRQPNHLERAAYVVGQGSRLGAEFTIKPADIVAGNDKLNLGFVAALFNACPGLEPPEEMPVFEDMDDAGLSREERALRMWVNSLGMNIDSLFDGMRDGLVLLRTMDAVRPGVVEWSRVCDKPRVLFNKIANCNYAIDLARARSGVTPASGFGFSLVGVQGKDIVDGNRKLTLALIWQLRRYNLMQVLASVRTRSNSPLDDAAVMRWANEAVGAAGSGRTMSGFADKSLGSGHFLLELLEAVRPGTVNRDLVMAGATDAERKDNAKYILSLARKLGCTVFLIWEDVVEVKPKMIFSFVATVMGLALSTAAVEEDAPPEHLGRAPSKAKLMALESAKQAEQEAEQSAAVAAMLDDEVAPEPQVAMEVEAAAPLQKTASTVTGACAPDWAVNVAFDWSASDSRGELLEPRHESVSSSA